MFKTKKQKAIDRILKAGENEIINGQIMLEYYQWLKDNLPEDATKEELGKADIKIKQMQDIIVNNASINAGFRAFLDSGVKNLW